MRSICLVMLVACGIQQKHEPIVLQLSADTGLQDHAYLVAAVDDLNNRLGEERIRIVESTTTFTHADVGTGNFVRFRQTDWSQPGGVEWGVTYRSDLIVEIELDDFASFPSFWFCTQLADDNTCAGTEEQIDSAPYIAERTIVHELGHALGIRFDDNPADVHHSPDKDDVMFPYLDPSVTTPWNESQWNRFTSQLQTIGDGARN